MYAMVGKLTAQSGKREDLIKILLRAASTVSELSGCRSYIVNEDVADPAAIWVFEVWDDKESHDASLKDKWVRALISEAMPLMAGPPEGSELKVAGGHGLT